MRFPAALVRPDAGGEWMLGAHHMTLLDGEMLVDEDLASGRQTRRFLAYDCMALAGKSLVDRPLEGGAPRPPARRMWSSTGCINVIVAHTLTSGLTTLMWAWRAARWP